MKTYNVTQQQMRELIERTLLFDILTFQLKTGQEARGYLAAFPLDGGMSMAFFSSAEEAIESVSCFLGLSVNRGKVQEIVDAFMTVSASKEDEDLPYFLLVNSGDLYNDVFGVPPGVYVGSVSLGGLDETEVRMFGPEAA